LSIDVDPEEIVYFQRIQVASIPPSLKNSDRPLGSFVVVQNLSISEGFSMSQVVFSNKYVSACYLFFNKRFFRQIGGGVLSRGTLQEEIRFITCPELIVSKLFCPLMMDNEAVVIDGVVQYTEHEGYADTFTCLGGLLEGPLISPQSIVAIDAVDFSQGKPYRPDDQYSKPLVERELLKAYAGFASVGNAKSIVTGNWGGGCFKVRRL
jgi:poly(ADP-ribose) glycohydrolase